MFLLSTSCYRIRLTLIVSLLGVLAKHPCWLEQTNV
uniref:Uncharacterized protein n=1 Tax=Arundo donax TaxID=35708 RepID=A0A0A8Z3E6_ARUDO